METLDSVSHEILILAALGALFLIGGVLLLLLKSNKKTKPAVSAGSSLKDVLISSKKDLSSILSQASTQKNLDQLEENLYECDLSPQVIHSLTQRAAKEVPDFSIEGLKSSFKKQMLSYFSNSSCLNWDDFQGPQIWVFVGVNGAGKTTTLAKVAHQAKAKGLRVLLVAGDTFRSAAREQLKTWADRLAVDILIDETIKDPAALAYKAVDKIEDYDLVLFDTAGRLQNKNHLMDELKKVKKVLSSRQELLKGQQTILVLDGSSGVNALSQAKTFSEQIGVTALIMTKLDGSFKGGALVSVSQSFSIPIAALGLGESLDDLKSFKADEFVNSIL